MERPAARVARQRSAVAGGRMPGGQQL